MFRLLSGLALVGWKCVMIGQGASGTPVFGRHRTQQVFAWEGEVNGPLAIMAGSVQLMSLGKKGMRTKGMRTKGMRTKGIQPDRIRMQGQDIQGWAMAPPAQGSGRVPRPAQRSLLREAPHRLMPAAAKAARCGRLILLRPMRRRPPLSRHWSAAMRANSSRTAAAGHR